MSQPNQFILSNLSDIILKSEGKIYDITPFVREINVTESLFVSYVRGSILLEDTASTRVLQSLPIKGGPETTVEFSFSGADGTQKNVQEEIKITHDNYYVIEIKPLSNTNLRTQSCIIHFIHKSFFENEKKKISKAFRQKKVSEIVESLGKEISLSWEEIEETKNIMTTGLPYNNCMDHIATMSKYAIRKENINDVNYLFWQNLKGKHNFVSLGKLYSQKPSFGNDINSGFIYGNYINNDYEILRRLTSEHTPIGNPLFENALAGSYTSGFVFVDKFYNNGYNYTSYDLRDEWKKQTHLSNNTFIDNNSKFWDLIEGPLLSRVYNISRHNYCCNEKEGGQRNEPYVAPRRLSQLAQLFQLGLQFITSGNSNLDQISAGKIVYFGRPLNYSPENIEQEDIFYSGKYLITTVKHIIKKGATPIPKYSCKIKCYKDSIGEE